MQIQFDAGPDGSARRFASPVRVIRADGPSEVDRALEAIDRAQADGAWVAGYLSYELGYALEPRLAPLMPSARDTPLIVMGVFHGCDPVPVRAAQAAPAALRPRAAAPSLAQYTRAFDRVMDYIRAGDVYQVNLTMPLQLECTGAADDLYAALSAAQPVGHGAFADLGGPILLSRSPELFFETDAAGRIATRPMKGTAARQPDAEADRAAAEALAASVKNRAENLMIVDLLRNDLSRICATGSVSVPSLFEVESYATVHQMTSTILGQLRPGLTPSGILRALFPCGSITGAPKIRAMEIIRELEDAPRGPYCGAIGWFAPDGASRFNVAIRTLVWHAPDRIVLNVGGGLVHDSTAEAEYAEALWKARFACPPGAFAD